MTQTAIQRSFAPLKKRLPTWLSNLIRSSGTAVLGPLLAAYRTGYFRSAFKMAAVSRDGQPLPWYTYPSIDFLKYRNYADKIILEFGGGQSTWWWAGRANQVVTLEGNHDWYEKLQGTMPANVALHYVSTATRDACVAEVRQTLAKEHYQTYDVIIIDGLYRYDMIAIALQRLAADGIIICDNAEGYGFYEGFKDTGLYRVDFFGNAPGVVLPHATSIYFRPAAAFVFAAQYPIPVIAQER